MVYRNANCDYRATHAYKPAGTGHCTELQSVLHPLLAKQHQNAQGQGIRRIVQQGRREPASTLRTTPYQMISGSNQDGQRTRIVGFCLSASASWIWPVLLPLLTSPTINKATSKYPRTRDKQNCTATPAGSGCSSYPTYRAEPKISGISRDD